MQRSWISRELRYLIRDDPEKITYWAETIPDSVILRFFNVTFQQWIFVAAFWMRRSGRNQCKCISIHQSVAKLLVQKQN